MPGWAGIAVPGLLSFVVCTFLAGRALSLVRMSVAVALSQLFFHTLFVLGLFAPGVSTAHHNHDMGAPAAVVTVSTSDVITMVHGDSTMWVWHAIAAIVTTAALYRGERTFAQMRALAVDIVLWVQRRVVVVLAPLAPPATVRQRAASTVPVLFQRVHLAAVRRRGPPLAHVI
ncbi:hypothetical protein FHX48_000320 [Microbacterium halimionae]|uniref:Uncharacterized protein n=1 Tax=Microbacterium halimionae TaxID=1526413 RepID=A0A7W3JLZ4_9MICO|nr:hypothetical protein [Microbacterium halimionae]MBA8815268.1 hypothetical protein [Microbacterium halimionae]NII93941.1 hypothetical protein [Microbacterium halimionae]